MGVRVEVRNLSFSFGSIKALRGVSLDAYEGQVTCLLGPNGSGKTTLLKCVMGLLSPYVGSIKVGGREVSEMSRREAARLMAYVPQIHRAVFPFSSLSVVLLGRTPWISEISGPGEEDVRKALKIMKEEGLKREEGLKVYLMAEVPSVIFLADRFAELCDGFSIGSNDLTQLILGVDRDSELLAKRGYFDENNLAVKLAISYLIRKAHEKGKTVSICGQAPSEYPEFTRFLVEQGIDSISVNPDVVNSVRKLVHDVENNL